MFEDLVWFGFRWQEGPDVGGPFGPYSQSERRSFYRAALDRLKTDGFIYPCTCSRRDVLRAVQAPHDGEEEPVYPGTCRPKTETGLPIQVGYQAQSGANAHINWRFRIPDGESVSFADGHYGPQSFVAGKDFGDFVVWRHDDTPAYHLAVVVDDSSMQITEVVRGEDLLLSTARQLLLYRALGFRQPAFYHCPLVTDAKGIRLAKRHDALSLRALRASGAQPAKLRAKWVSVGET
jgi:glutamyl-tRNA synthetase